MTAVAIRGVSYPVVLPKLRDPRLHLAATITSLQVLGQVAFHFRLSIAQILVALGTAAVIDVAVAFRRQRVLMWPASALLTANGVAFVLRAPGTRHGDWWSLHDWWLYMAVAGGSLLSKHVVRWRGEHIFNPSNIGLVVCFLLLGRGRAEPLDFWWGPMSWWMALALAIIVTGGLAILSRLGLLRVAVAFWVAFAASIALLAWRGHVMTARWHLGPISGFHFWSVLVTSPEVLVFLFFMITDPKTAPGGRRERVVYGAALGVLGAVLIAPTTTEFAAKVALLAALAVVCASRPFLRAAPRVAIAAAAPAAAAAIGVLVLVHGGAAPSLAAAPAPARGLPRIAILPSPGVQTKLSRRDAESIVGTLTAAVPASTADTVSVRLVPGTDQGPPSAVARLAGRTYHLALAGYPQTWTLQGAKPRPTPAPARASRLAGLRLRDIAPAVGLDFRQGAFRFGMSSDYGAMMGGGVCWLDYNGDGWQDLFVVNGWSDADAPQWEAHGGLPRAALFENVRGRFRDVSASTHAGLAVRGDGCAAADIDGDGRPDIVLTTDDGVKVLWNRGGSTFAAAELTSGRESSSWYTGAAVADVNGDGRLDVFAAGYTDLTSPVPNALAGFPTDHEGVRDLLFINEGARRFREAGAAAGVEAAAFGHGLGAAFLDSNRDGRPDLYVANDEDPNQLYENVPWPGGAKADPAGLGFRFEERAAAEGVADRYAGMGIAAADYDGDGRLDLFVTNSRHEPSAAFRGGVARFAGARGAFVPALGTDFAGWGASFVDLTNAGRPDVVLAAGAIPVTSLARGAEPVRVLTPTARGGTTVYGSAATALPAEGIRLDGRGVAAADAGNDGRMDVAVNTIGGRLVLLRQTGHVGHWLEVRTKPLSPGATVTVELAHGRRLVRQVQAGSSYLSSEDPRVHFGLGRATVAARVVVRFPFGGTRVLHDVAADRVVVVRRPPTPRPASAGSTPVLAACTPAAHGRASVAQLWDETAVAVLREAGASEPEQARTLFRVSAAMWDAWAAYDPAAKQYLADVHARGSASLRAREEAISFAAYRVLLWDISFGHDLDRTFAALNTRLRSLCFSPAFASTASGSPAAVGNRVAASIVAAGHTDGSLERAHFVDASYAPENQPLVLAQGVSTVHDATFWQPLALAQVAPQGLAPIPAAVQTFVDAQWGHVRSFALPSSARGLPLDPGAPRLGDPSSRPYEDAALAAIREASGPAAVRGPDGSPTAWNAATATLPRRGVATARLRSDVRVYFTLNAALHDAAVAAWGAKRAYQAPRPISMVRYLAFQGQSSDLHGASYAAEGLPLVQGLTELSPHGTVLVRERGRWVAGARWTPLAPTPASPGWVSENGTFAYAAATVLRTVTGRSFDSEAVRLARSGVDSGTETPGDLTAGRALGIDVARRVLARAQQFVGR
ncbi:MAG TPA: FG-GAP-like repeat-containing protein [Gaiellaceae bacterium]